MIDTTFWRRRSGDVAVVFVHGFLDDGHVWDRTIAALQTPGIETVQLDLAGAGARADATGTFTFERLAADVGAVVDRVAKPFVIVGHSMGAPVAELVAAARTERALGLVLLTPVPLAGMRLPDPVVEPFRALGGDAEAQRAARRQLAVNLSEADLDRLGTAGLRMWPETVRALVYSWNTGHADAPEPSRYAGPVLVVRGGGDGFVTKELVATAVAPRFPAAQTVVVDGAGHWPHVEQPAAVASHLDRFIAAHGVEAVAGRWTNAFAGRSADAFAAAFADDVVLEASVLTRPVEGRDRVARVMAAGSEIYESLVFTQEVSAGGRSYLEWQASAFGGMALEGVTILSRDAAGRIVRAAIHHRPLDAVLRFSAELRERLAGIVDADFFHDAATVSKGSR
jgi:pimeloyl-ACP methyl ester carboxylesterase